MSCYLCDDCQNEMDEAIDSAEAMAVSGAIQRIDRDALAGVLDDCFPGCDGAAAEDFIERYAVIAADAVLAALPELMGEGGQP